EEQTRADQLAEEVRANAELLAAVNQVRQGETFEAFLMRFIRARPDSESKALAMLEEDVKWREEEGIVQLSQTPAADVFGGDAQLAAYCKMQPHGIIGRDQLGRPVVYKGYGAFRMWDAARPSGVELAHCIRYNEWLNERMCAAIGHQGQWTTVVDVQGTGLGQCLSKQQFAFTKAIVESDASHYPERCGQIFVINAPRFFSGTFGLIARWIPEKTRYKVQILAGPDKWGPILAECFDPSLLPVELGGAKELTLQGLCPSLQMVEEQKFVDPAISNVEVKEAEVNN
ncbi:unnamed protein product, partial [Polarella glacialis]